MLLEGNRAIKVVPEKEETEDKNPVHLSQVLAGLEEVEIMHMEVMVVSGITREDTVATAKRWETEVMEATSHLQVQSGQEALQVLVLLKPEVEVFRSST